MTLTDVISYPRSYYASFGWKIFMLTLGCPLAIGGIIGAWYFGTSHEMRSATEATIFAAGSLAMACLGLWCAIGALVSKLLVLKEDSLVVPRLFGDVEIHRSDIVGYRIWDMQGGRQLRLEWTVPGKPIKTTNVSMIFKADAAFLDWFEGLSDLDAVELDASIKEVESDVRLGNSPEARFATIDKSRKIGRAMNLLVLLLSAWALFYPSPYEVVISTLAVVPLVALILCWKCSGAFTIDDSGKHRARTDLTVLLIAPGFILALRALNDAALIEATELILPTLFGLIVLALCITWVAPVYRTSIGKLLLVVALLAAYPASTIAIANVRLDYSPGVRQQLLVLKKHRTSGNGATQYFSVAPWASKADINDIKVPRDVYQKIDVGQSVCVILHSGAFGLSWYSIAPGGICRQ